MEHLCAPSPPAGVSGETGGGDADRTRLLSHTPPTCGDPDGEDRVPGDPGPVAAATSPGANPHGR